jgi:hypothetical protein
LAEIGRARISNGGFEQVTEKNEDAAIKRLYLEGISLARIGQQLGVSKSFVSSRVKSMGLSRPGPATWQENPIVVALQAAIDANDFGHGSVPEIANRLGLSRQRVHAVAQKMGISDLCQQPRPQAKAS